MPSTNVKNLRNSTLTIRDASLTPKNLVIAVEDGNLAITVKDPSFLIRNRGKIVSRRKGDEEQMEVSFDFKFTQWSGDAGASAVGNVSVLDVLRGKGAAVGNVTATDNCVSTDTDGCAPWAMDLIFKIFTTCDQTATGDYEQLILSKFHAESVDFKEGSEANTISVKGMCLVTEPDASYVITP